MKYTVTFSCGHTEEVELFGKGSDRERKIAWYEKSGLCPECYKAMKEAEKKNNSVAYIAPYGEYKTIKQQFENDNVYGVFETAKNSYNAMNKTIKVYVKKQYYGVDFNFAEFERQYPNWQREE